jgi:hypothetical protein
MEVTIMEIGDKTWILLGQSKRTSSGDDAIGVNEGLSDTGPVARRRTKIMKRARRQGQFRYSNDQSPMRRTKYINDEYRDVETM